MGKHSPISEQTLFEYLNQKLKAELGQSPIQLTDDTVYYLGQMLNYFAQSDNLFVNELNSRTLPTLALLYRDARETRSISNKNKLLRKLGDSALFMGAWFAQVYQRKGIRRDYFIGMSSAAYDYLADNDYHQRNTFAELSNHVPQLLTITAKVLSRDAELSTEDIFSLYKQWLAGKDPRLKQQLEVVGIVPVDSNYHH